MSSPVYRKNYSKAVKSYHYEYVPVSLSTGGSKVRQTMLHLESYGRKSLLKIPYQLEVEMTSETIKHHIQTIFHESSKKKNITTFCIFILSYLGYEKSFMIRYHQFFESRRFQMTYCIFMGQGSPAMNHANNFALSSTTKSTKGETKLEKYSYINNLIHENTEG